MRFHHQGLSGYNTGRAGHKFTLSEKGLEMLKVAACLVLATWMTACLMMVVYSREIAHFMVERLQ